MNIRSFFAKTSLVVALAAAGVTINPLSAQHVKRAEDPTVKELREIKEILKGLKPTPAPAPQNPAPAPAPGKPSPTVPPGQAPPSQTPPQVKPNPGQTTPPPQVTPAPKPEVKPEGRPWYSRMGTMRLIIGIAVVLVLLVLIFRVAPKVNRNRRDRKAANQYQVPPAPESDNKGQNGIGLISLMLLLSLVSLVMFSFVAHAAVKVDGCVLTKVGNDATVDGMRTLVQGQNDTVFCGTNAPSITVFDGDSTNSKPVKGLVPRKVAGGFEFNITPTAKMDVIRIANGSVTVGLMTVGTAHEVWVQFGAVNTLRPEIAAVNSRVDNVVNADLELAKTVRSLSTQVSGLDTRVYDLEHKPAPAAPKIDMSAYDRKLADMQATIDRQATEIADAKRIAGSADRKVDKLATAEIRDSRFPWGGRKTLQELADRNQKQ